MQYYAVVVIPISGSKIHGWGRLCANIGSLTIAV